MRSRSAAVATYRAGATLWPFLIWALGGAVGAFFAGRQALTRPADSLDRWGLLGLGAALVLLGPLSFGFHLLRRLLVRVTLDPGQGLILSGDRLVRWKEIEGIDHRPARFRAAQSFLDPAEMEEAPYLPSRALLFVILFRCLLAIVYYLLLPPLLILSPWHPCVTVRLMDGRRLVYRDMDRDGEFVFRVRKAIAR